MIGTTQDYLYSLLPTVYRRRDAEQGWPLRALLRVIEEQVEVVKKDIDQLYDNWFIETCQDWVVPYIGDLIGYVPVHDSGQPTELAAEQLYARNKILIPRAEVANTIRNRRRKGTLALLEWLAYDVAGWTARALEFYTLLSFTQSLNHLRLGRGCTVDVRHQDGLSRVNGPFDELAHTIDLRRTNSSRTVGRYNIPGIGVFVWRLKTFSITHSPVYYLEKHPPHYFTFSVLGNDLPLYRRSASSGYATHANRELDLPVAIRRTAFQGETITLEDGTERTIASADFYGTDKSVALWAPDWAGNDPQQPIPRKAVIPADLSEWKYEPPENFVAIDPELGRIAFPPDQIPEKGAWVYYNYGAMTEIGGGEYSRPISDPSANALSLSLFRTYDFKNARDFVLHLKEDPGEPLSRYLRQQFSASTLNSLNNHESGTEPSQDLLAALADELTTLIQAGPLDETLVPVEKLTPETIQLLARLHAGQLSEQDIIRLNRLLLEAAYPDELMPSYKLYRVGATSGLFGSVTDALDAWRLDKPRDAIVEMVDSGVYTVTESIEIRFAPFQSLQIRAAIRTRPVLRLLDVRFSGRDAIVVVGAPGSRFTIDGLLIFGRGLHVEQEIEEVNIRHSTLVPGWELQPGCESPASSQVSLRLTDTNTRVAISHSILGSIEVLQHEVKSDPIQIAVTDSILDATEERLDALSAGDGQFAHAILTVVRCTIFGQVFVHALQLAENSLFTGVVVVARRQIGCMRFCYVLPERQGTEEESTLLSRTPRRYNCQPDLVEKNILQKLEQTELLTNQKTAAISAERLRVHPCFDGICYGLAAYGRLSDSCATEIKTGADDESEMGVYHDLFQPQREANLRTRLDEYTPAGMDAGIFYAS
jgi:hypothetical protein